MIAILDAGPLYAWVDADDKDHLRSLQAIQRPDLDIVVPALVIAEVSYFVERRLGPRTEADFLRAMADLEVVAPAVDDWPAIADLVERYSNFPLGGTDASVAVLAERLDTNLIITLDRRHFGALRMPGGRTFTLLPD